MTRGERLFPAGRIAAYRRSSTEAYCPSCSIRLVVGEPKPDGKWSALTLTPLQIRLLLSAAAEFDEDSNGLSPSAVEFVDWLTPDVLGDREQRDYDGIRRMGETPQGHWPPLVSVGKLP